MSPPTVTASSSSRCRMAATRCRMDMPGSAALWRRLLRPVSWLSLHPFSSSRSSPPAASSSSFQPAGGRRLPAMLCEWGPTGRRMGPHQRCCPPRPHLHLYRVDAHAGMHAVGLSIRRCFPVGTASRRTSIVAALAALVLRAVVQDPVGVNVQHATDVQVLLDIYGSWDPGASISCPGGRGEGYRSGRCRLGWVHANRAMEVVVIPSDGARARRRHGPRLRTDQHDSPVSSPGSCQDALVVGAVVVAHFCRAILPP